ncbi:MAG: hypothetical protein SH819_13340 [Cytophagales bacterium]|nr:hypothetical protein [Cytophagales bacterium]
MPRLLPLALLLTGCLGNDNFTHTTVHDDGSLERVITITDNDSTIITKNVFGINEQNGWTAERIPAENDSSSYPNKQTSIRFTRTFESADQANEAMDASPDALFKIKSEYQITNHWLFTDLLYRDTYAATIRFTYVHPDSFFTQNDYDFINRQRKGGPRNTGDSLRQRLFDSKFEEYIERGFFEEVYALTLSLMKENRMEGRWLDSVRRHKDLLHQSLMTGDFNPEILQSVLTQNLKVPVRFSLSDIARLEALDRIFFGLFDRFGHSIRMPHGIVDSNADSTAGRVAFWKPQGNLVKDFTMQVQSRHVNYTGAFIVIVLLAALMFLMRRVVFRARGKAL